MNPAFFYDSLAKPFRVSVLQFKSTLIFSFNCLDVVAA